jgi:chromate transporter
MTDTARASLVESGSGTAQPTLAGLTREMAKIGILSFGGATAQIAMLHRVAVDDGRWMDEQRFLRALNLCMLLPGPEAQQLATYIGWHARGVPGGIVAGVLFVLPGALIMLALSLMYALGTGLSLVDGLFFGIKAAVLAIVAQAVIKLAKRALKGTAPYVIAALAFVGFAFLAVPFPFMVFAAALAGIATAGQGPAAPVAPPTTPASDAWATTVRAVAGGLAAWWLPVLFAGLALGFGHRIVELALFFSKLAVLSFGGAYALLVWLADEAVQRTFLTTRDMIAGLGLAETKPGPTILVTQFVGFLGAYNAPGSLSPILAAVIGAVLTTWVTFAPSFLWIFAAAPWLDRLLANRTIAHALQGITAAVLGAILWLALLFALNTIFTASSFTSYGWLRWPIVRLADIDLAALALALVALGLTFVARRGMITTIGITAALGIIVTLLLR